MKKIKYIILLLILASGTLYAQPDKQRMEKIRAIKVAYITDKIQLTTQQAERFWPVYRKYEEELRSARRQNIQKHGGRKAMQDDEARQRIEDDLEMQEKVLYIRKKYKNEFLTIISAQQLAALYEAEREFKKMLVQQLKDRRERGTLR